MKRMLKKLFTGVLLVSLIIGSSIAVFGDTEVKEPDITAQAAIVYCENTGEIVYSKKINEKMSPYSTTKLMTVLLAVQNLPLDKKVTVSAKAASIGESTMDLEPGEIVTVEQLIYGTLLPSGNDAAYALGEAVSGNMSDFIVLMNKTAQNIGCKNTHFTSANGLVKSSDHYTSAYDLMQISKVAFSNEIIKKAAGTKVYKMTATNKSEARELKNSNELLFKNIGIVAGKTGSWDDYNATVSLAYKKNGLSLYIVLLGDTQKERSNDAVALINYATEKVEGVKVIGKDKSAGKVRINHGEKTRIDAYTNEIGYAYLPKEGSKSLVSTKVVMDTDIKAPVKAGKTVGKYQIYVADELVNEVDLVIKEDVKTGWFPSYVGISNVMTLIICAVLIVTVVLLIIFAAKKSKAKKRKQRLREEKIIEMAKEQARIEEEHKERGWKF